MDRLILPFASLDAKRKQVFSSEMELAAVMCLAEGKRKKKGGVLGGEPERVNSVSKLYYPIWLVPWEHEYVTVDGMGLFTFEALFEKLPDLASFEAKIRESEKSYERFMQVLEQNFEAFEAFPASERIVIEGIVSDKELQSAILDYFKKEIATKEPSPRESAFLQENLDMKTAVVRVEEFIKLLDRNQSDIDALQKTISLLDIATEAVQKELAKDIENVRQKYAAQIDEIKPQVEEKVNQLTSERDEKIRTIGATLDKEIETKNMDKSDYEKKLVKLKQDRSFFDEKKEAAKLRKDEVYVKRWKLRVKDLDKQISEHEKMIRKLQKHIDDTKKEKEKTLKQINENYQGLIQTEMDKIPSLEMARDKEISEIEEKIEQARAKTMVVIKQVQRLVDEKRDALAALKEIAVSWRLKDVFLVYLPFYAVNYVAGAKQHYEFFAPVLASGHEGILKAIRKKFWGASLESRINLLLKQRSKALERMFSSVLFKRIEEDYELRNHLSEKIEQNNVLVTVDFKEKLVKGLDALVLEEWVKPEEKDVVLQVYAK
ncbi:MAG: hypothetical protein ACQXXH_01810 [Candidatus Bathyarchaeia archaeon]|nr:hypothetical protein [Candidatus Bathyarchaeota archaeon A05DMB-4]MDH7596055.1 hypothetical protein [Candidatus Bathyarchaeota archaeon]